MDLIRSEARLLSRMCNKVNSQMCLAIAEDLKQKMENSEQLLFGVEKFTSHYEKLVFLYFITLSLWVDLWRIHYKHKRGHKRRLLVPWCKDTSAATPEGRISQRERPELLQENQ